MSLTLAALRDVEERQRAHRQDEAMPEAEWLTELDRLHAEWRRLWRALTDEERRQVAAEPEEPARLGADELHLLDLLKRGA